MTNLIFAALMATNLCFNMDGTNGPSLTANYCDTTESDLCEAVDAAWEYIKPDNGVVHTVYYTPAQQLRNAADRLDNKNAAMSRLKEALDVWRKRKQENGDE